MPRPIPTLRSVALGVLRRVRGWTGRDLARAAAVSETMISYYESGHRCPSHKVLLALAAAMGFKEDEVSCVLFGLAGVAAPSDPPAKGGLEPEGWRALRHQAVRAGLQAAEAAEARLIEEAQRRRAEEERRQADGRFRRLLKIGEAQREACLEANAGRIDWALVERLCEESERAAASDPRSALAWAGLALRAAERIQGTAALRGRVTGYAWAFVGNARRVANDLPGAEEAFTLAWRHWRKGKALAAPPLGEWYLHDREASLRRAQRSGTRALILHDRAISLAPGEPRGRLLLNKATTLGTLDRPAEALTVLAASWIDRGMDLRMSFALAFNQAVNLHLLGRPLDAEAILPDVRARATELRNELDVVRTLWLQAKIDSSLGRRQSALTALEQVRREFCSRELAYDAALAALESAALLLEDGCTVRVRELAEELVWIFGAQGVGREALASLRVFHQAALRETATAALVRQALAIWQAARPAAGA